MDDVIERMRNNVIGHLEEISKMFVPEMKFTFIARDPRDPERDVFISDDAVDEVVRAVQRAGVREGK